MMIGACKSVSDSTPKSTAPSLKTKKPRPRLVTLQLLLFPPQRLLHHPKPLPRSWMKKTDNNSEKPDLLRAATLMPPRQTTCLASSW